MRWKTVIHVHTDYSSDSNQSPAQLVESALRERIDCIAVTDHDTIDGAMHVRSLARLSVIVGEEITTRDGHLLGLFLHATIPPGLSAEETIAEIRSQGGLALAPHPFSRLAQRSLLAATSRIAPLLDGVEVHNAQNPLPWEDGAAARFAAKHGLPGFVGADTHLAGRLAPCYQMLDPFHGPREFLHALRAANCVRGRYGPVYIARMAARHVCEHILHAPLASYGRNHAARRLAAAQP
jgi:hypothetical protein